MSRPWMIVLILVTVSATANAAVYRWVDADGVTHFSDKPVAGAEEIGKREPTVFKSTPPIEVKPSSSANTGAAAKGDAGSGYTMSFVTPQPGSTVREVASRLPVLLSIQPPPRFDRGMSLRITLDGAVVGGDFKAASMVLPGVTRGTHKISGELVNLRGEVIASTPETTFYVHQRSKLNP